MTEAAFEFPPHDHVFLGKDHDKAERRTWAVIVLHEFQFALVRLARLHQANPGQESMRFRNFVTRFQVAVPLVEREQMAAAIRSCGLDGDIGRRQHAGIGADVEARRHMVLEHLDFQHAAAELDAPGGLAVIVTMRMTMAVIVMMPAGQ